MPVDLAFSTNSVTATLERRQLQPLADRSRFTGFLIVRSGAFAAAVPFGSTHDALQQFSDELDLLCKERKGTAQLTGSDGEDAISFEGTTDARLRIWGTLYDVEVRQLLRFAFAARWEGTRPFADELRQLVNAKFT